MQAAITIAPPSEAPSWDSVLDHVAGCDTCLRVIVDLDLPTAACEERCSQLRELLKSENQVHSLQAV